MEYSKACKARDEMGSSWWTVLAIAFSLTTSPVYANSSLFWVSDPVAPDETVLVMGDQLKDTADIWVARLADDPSRPTSESTEKFHIKPIQATATSLKFVLPENLGTGVYRIGFGRQDAATYELNAPSIYWLQGDQGISSSAGGWVRVLGRNIARNSDARLTLTRAGQSEGITLRPSSSNLWNATFRVPVNLGRGTYIAKLWNGNGDVGAWRDAGTWNVEMKASLPTLTVDVKDFRATGDGVHDDTEALKAALHSLDQRGGGTLLLPRGQYRLSQGLRLPSHTILKGEDRALVRLIWAEMVIPPFALIQGASDFAIEDLTIFAGNHGHVISGGFVAGSDDSEIDARNIAIRRVTVRASMYRDHLTPDQVSQRFKAALKFSSGGPDTVRLSGENLTIEDCDLYGSGRSFYLRQPRGAYIARNKFYNGRWGWYSISGPDGVIFEQNEVIGADLQSTGGGVNTLHQVTQFAQNVAFLHNRFKMMEGWDREALTSDGPRGCYYGPIASISNDGWSATLPERATDNSLDMKVCIGAGIFVLGGKGMGQVRRVQAVEADTIKLDHPFDVPPDSSSVISITSYQRNYLMIGNEFSDTGIAVQFYGSAVNHVIADNVSRRSLGFRSKGLQYKTGYQPTWYTQFLGNRIAEGDLGSDALIAVWGAQKLPNRAPLSLATIVRNNHLDGNAHIEVKGYIAGSPGVQDVVIEGNQVDQAEIGISIDEGVRDALLRRNSFHKVATPISDRSSHESQ